MLYWNQSTSSPEYIEINQGLREALRLKREKETERIL
jgi:hypothetical protein